MDLSKKITAGVKAAAKELYDLEVPVELQATRKDFEGDVTVVLFPLVKILKGNPAAIGEKIGQFLMENVAEVSRFNIVSGFLNLVIGDSYYLQSFDAIRQDPDFGKGSASAEGAMMVEYSSPNTNKPLHLGHVRNNLLGWSVAEILKASGRKVYKTQIVNDRGIHICKSMVAWKHLGEGQTPDSTGIKGDKFVGNYYVAFDRQYKDEIADLIASGLSEDDAKKQAPIMLEAQKMLRDWEAGEQQTMKLWKMMNSWVYKGFATTYKNMGVDFDREYYESNTYLLGRDVVMLGLEKGVFEKDNDGSVWIDLTGEGLDRKIVLRADGTAVYMTQDIGTAIQRVRDFPDIAGMVYTVGNEQDYHFKVLFLILKKLGFDWAEHLYHLSYGMVDLPSGKMKSREGTVVDADDLMTDMTDTARKISEELGKLDGFTDAEKVELYRTIGMGALKYYILKVDPKKRILFNPEESVDFAGNTGPFIQYTYARIQSILRRADFDYKSSAQVESMHEKEREVIKSILELPSTIQLAAQQHSPAIIANYTYDLVKNYNSFYQSVQIFGEENLEIRKFRVQLSAKTADAIALCFSLLGIDVPERM